MANVYQKSKLNIPLVSEHQMNGHKEDYTGQLECEIHFLSKIWQMQY